MKRIYLLLPLFLLILASCGSKNKGSSDNKISEMPADITYTIGALMGSTHDEYVSHNYPKAKIMRMDVEPDLFVALDAGKIDIAMLDYSVYKTTSGNKDKYRELAYNFTEDFGIGFKYADKELCQQFNTFLAEIRASGIYDQVLSRWFDNYETAKMPVFSEPVSGTPLRVGSTGTTDGFCFIRDGVPSGFDSEIITRFAYWLGRPVEFSMINFGGLIAALNSGKIDVIACGLTITEERKAQVLFSDPYYLSKAVSIVKKERYGGADSATENGANTLKGLEDIATSTVGVKVGTWHDQWIIDHYPSAKLLLLDSYPDVVVSLEKGKSDIIFVESAMYDISMKKKGIYEVLGVVAEDLLGVGFNKENTALRDQYNAFLKEIKADGTFDQLIERWIDNNATAEMPDLPPPPTGKPLRLGCSGANEGFDYVKNGKNVGIDIELMERFGRYIGRPIQYYNLNFGGLIAALTSGTVDVISSAISITEERSKQVAFSDPYYSSNSIAVALKSRTGSKDNTLSREFRQMSDLQDKRIGVLMGSIQDNYIAETYPNASIQRIDLTPDLVYALKSGQCDAIVLPHPTVKEILAKNSDLALFDADIYPIDLGVGFRDQQLRDRFNLYVKEIQSTGIYDEMVKRWIDNTESAVMPKIDVPVNAKTLVVGTSGVSVPFGFVKDGEMSGFDAELVTRFAASEGYAVRFSTMTFGALIPALKSGKIDLLADMAMITEERQKEVLFSDPYFRLQSTVLVKAKDLPKRDPHAARDGSDLATSTVAVMTGTISEIYIQENCPNARMLIFDDIMDAIAALKAGKLDYVMTAYTTALLAANKNDDLIVLPETYTKDPAGIAMRLDNRELYNQINPILLQYKENGQLDEIINRWVKNDDKPYAMVEIPKATEGKPLRVAVSANREPMCFVSNNKIVGLDCELIERIAYELGRPVEYVDMKFSALIASLESGRTDLIISNFGITEERKSKILYTDEYYLNPQVLLTLQDKTMLASSPQKGWFEGLKESFYNNLILENRYQLIVDGLKETIFITLFAALLGTIFGGIICFLRMSKNIACNAFAKAYISVMRGTPLLVLLMIFFYVVFAKSGLSASVVAIFTFALNMAAYSSEMFRTSIEGVDRGQQEAGIALGFTKVQTFIFIILPQAVKTVLPIYKGEVISLLKMTSIVGYIAVVDLTKASDIIRSRTFDAFFPLIVVAIIYFVLAWMLGAALDLLNKKISTK
ncbi:ABC transporter permease subunit [Parabacteroides sp. OttesenSCG-928-N08]|nr:ABC transporter permease subunit [Parabacteroides sp. OttesenSCG-928-N08]